MMTKTLPTRQVYFIFLALLLVTIHIPVAFAKNPEMGQTGLELITETGSNENTSTSLSMTLALYDSLDLSLKGLSEEAYTLAVQGYDRLVNEKRIADRGIISIADFTKSSAKKRLFVIDLKKAKILFQTYVAHGRNSGDEYATKFSNIPESFSSSLGFYSTSGTYYGGNGYSMYLEGLEPGINDKAHKRAIVMHGADYANESFIHNKGYLGRSFGCPAVPENMNRPIINRIKNGTCLFIYSNKGNYVAKSKVV